MTTFLYQDGCFYSDTRAYFQGQSFNISNKIVPLTEPIQMKATLDKATAKPIVLDETIYGYFIVHAVEPGRALFNSLVESAKQHEGHVQGVIDNFGLFLTTFKLASYDAHFSLVLIGGTGTYCISTPMAIGQEMTYEYSPYVDPVTKNDMAMAYGANHEHLTTLVAAGTPAIIGYYTLFLRFIESGGNVEIFRLRQFKDKMFLARDDWYPEVSAEKMRNAIDDWLANPRDLPLAEMSSIYNYGPKLLSSFRLEKYITDQGFSMTYDDRDVLTHLVPKRGQAIDLRGPRAARPNKKGK